MFCHELEHLDGEIFLNKAIEEIEVMYGILPLLPLFIHCLFSSVKWAVKVLIYIAKDYNCVHLCCLF